MPHFGLPEAWTPADQWEAVRRSPRHNDEALTGTTRQWLRRLPASRRPQQLCVLYPRLANRLAWHWRDLPQRQAVLDDLLIDRRGGRQGFPKPVVQELRRLREFSDLALAPDHTTSYLDALRQFWSRH